jgi:hypothetical protein
MERNPATIADMTPVQAKVAVTVRELSAENQRLQRQLADTLWLYEQAVGHRPGIADYMRAMDARVRAMDARELEC